MTLGESRPLSEPQFSHLGLSESCWEVLHTGAGLVCRRVWRAASTCFLTLASLVLPFRYTRMHVVVCRHFLGLCDPEFILEQPHPRRWALTLEGGGGGGHQVRRLRS